MTTTGRTPPAHALQVGDVLVKPWGKSERVFVVVKVPTKYSKSRKTFMLRLHSGTLADNWWERRDRLPKKYRYVGQVPQDFVDELMKETA